MESVRQLGGMAWIAFSAFKIIATWLLAGLVFGLIAGAMIRRAERLRIASISHPDAIAEGVYRTWVH